MVTLYHTKPTFSNPEKDSFRKNCGKSRQYWLAAFSLFPTMFSTFLRTNFNVFKWTNTADMEKPRLVWERVN